MKAFIPSPLIHFKRYIMASLKIITLSDLTTRIAQLPNSAQQIIIDIIIDRNNEIELDQLFHGYFTTSQVNALLACYDLSADMAKQQLCRDLILLAQYYSLAPISNYHVGAVALGNTGAIYLGANMEFKGVSLGQSVHAEQSAISNAWSHKESNIIMLAVSAPPCGHCRQFINELESASQIQILVNDKPAESFSTLLPQPFGPEELDINERLMMAVNNSLITTHNDSLVRQAFQAANNSYSPYTNSPSGISLQTSTNIYRGSYAENCAYNPSLSPLQAALIALNLAGDNINDITRGVLVESNSTLVSQYQTSFNLLKIISDVSLEIINI